jgi:hypothetical protein
MNTNIITALNAIKDKESPLIKSWDEKTKKYFKQTRDENANTLERTKGYLGLFEIINQISNSGATSVITKELTQIMKNFKIGGKESKYFYDIVQTDGNGELYIHELRLLLLCMALNPLCVPMFTYTIFEAFISDKTKNPKGVDTIVTEIKNICNQRISLKFNLQTQDLKGNNLDPRSLITQDANIQVSEEQIDGYTTRVTTGNFTIFEEFINAQGGQLNTFITGFNDNGPIWSKVQSGHGYSSIFDGRQVKIVFYIHLMNRLILLNRTDLIEELYKRIIDHKINNFLKKYIMDETKDTNRITNFINGLIESNFKGQYLKTELKQTNKWDFDTNNKATFKAGATIMTEQREEIFNIIKYDYLINGFEGLYINENIMGLIKYLSDERLTGKTGEKIASQDINLRFQYQQRTARLMLMTKNFIPESDTQNVVRVAVYQKMMNQLMDLQGKLIEPFKMVYDEKLKFEALRNTMYENNPLYKRLLIGIKESYTNQIPQYMQQFRETYVKMTQGDSSIQAEVNGYTPTNAEKFITDHQNKSLAHLLEIQKRFIKETAASKIYDYERLFLHAICEIYQYLFIMIRGNTDSRQQLDWVFPKNTTLEKSTDGISERERALLKGSSIFIIHDLFENINPEMVKSLYINKDSNKQKLTLDTDDVTILKNLNLIKVLLGEQTYKTFDPPSHTDLDQDGNTFNSVIKDLLSSVKNKVSSVSDEWITIDGIYGAGSTLGKARFQQKFGTQKGQITPTLLFLYIHEFIRNYINKYEGTYNLLSGMSDTSPIKFIMNNIHNMALRNPPLIDKYKKQTIPPYFNNSTSLTDSLYHFIEAVYEKNVASFAIQKDILKVLDKTSDIPILYDSIKPDFSPQPPASYDSPDITYPPMPSQITFDINNNFSINATIDTVGILGMKKLELIGEYFKIVKKLQKLYTDKRSESGNALESHIGKLNKMNRIIGDYLIGVNNLTKSTATQGGENVEKLISSASESQYTYSGIDSIGGDNGNLVNFKAFLNQNILSVQNFDENSSYSKPGDGGIPEYKFPYGTNDIDTLKKINFTIDGDFLNNLDLVFNQLNNFSNNTYSISDQLFILKHLENLESTKSLQAVATKGKDGESQFIAETAKKFHMKTEDYKKFSEDYGNLFKAGMVYRKDNKQKYIVEKMYDYINDSYSSSKLFSVEKPLIQNILESYLPPEGSTDFSKSYVTDFKVFYLFANYDDGNKGLNVLKCKNQYDLLENTLGFIEAIRR